MDFFRENYLVFVCIGTVVAFFLIRDTLAVFRVHRMRERLKQDSINSERQMEEIVAKLDQSRRALDESLLSVRKMMSQNPPQPPQDPK